MIYNNNGLPVPQVLPVPLDTEDEVDQVKHMVIVLTEIRSAPDSYRQTTHRWETLENISSAVHQI